MNTTLSMAVPVVIGLALVVRLVSLPLLLRFQRNVRQRALAARGGGSAPKGLAALFGEIAVGFACGGGLMAVMTFAGLAFRVLRMPIDIVNARDLAVAQHLRLSVARNYYLVLVITVLVLWLLFWFLTQRRLLRTGMPPEVWSAGSTRLRLAGWFVLRAVLGALVLPVGLLLAALVFQIVAAVTAGRHRTATPPAPAVPPAVPPAFPPVQPGAYAPATPYAPTAGAQQPSAYTPTQAAPVPAAPPRTGPVTPLSPVGAVPHQPLRAGEPRTIGGYQLLGRIGSGGMGTVYLARREGAATQVALKTINVELLDNAELLLRFEREAEVLAMVSGAYTARVLDGGVDDGRPYLAMELLDGRPLDAHLREQGPVRSAEALRALALALAVALSGVHRLGLIHRDLKPANIMLTTAGPRLLDFGIAALVDGTRLTMTGGGPGTLTYMAPEQFGEERVGTAADVWAWACCVVCAAHGASPFAATSTGAVIRRIVDTGPEPAALAAVHALDPALAAVVARALNADPAGRPADGAALLELLTASPDAGSVREEITRGWRTLAL
ncbi:serine/threonine-protein kinase [Kitasatospora sp. NPDC086801]|uniref:serine/threonine-protein kinase n=1 Tax=Kitasatospora sp. NPDC086801 TaxID=3364066 RepID=UPI00381C8232